MVVSACELVTRADVRSTEVSVRVVGVNTFLAHAQEIADMHGITLEVRRTGDRLLLRFSNQPQGGNR